MNIIELAREAGMPIDDGSFIFQARRERVIRFANLIRAEVLEEAAEWFLYEDNKNLLS